MCWNIYDLCPHLSPHHPYASGMLNIFSWWEKNHWNANCIHHILIDNCQLCRIFFGAQLVKILFQSNVDFLSDRQMKGGLKEFCRLKDIVGSHVVSRYRKRKQCCKKSQKITGDRRGNRESKLRTLFAEEKAILPKVTEKILSAHVVAQKKAQA